MILKKYIGNKSFYVFLAAIVLPIILQNGITQFVSLLDNIMVGRLGTEQMSGVAIVNQIVFIFYLCIFGGMAGAGIFTAQFFGKGDIKGIRYTFRFKIITGIIIVTVACAVFILFGDNLIRAFLSESDDVGDIEFAFQSGREYMRNILLTFPLFAITQIYASTLRETGKTVPPMVASLISVGFNFTFNYLLIFGKLGFPEMGVVGAAAATLISRVAECFILIAWAHRKKSNNVYLQRIYTSFKIEGELVKQILLKGTPLLFNELLWSVGMTMLAQAYSTRGIDSVAAYNISTTVSNLFGIVFISMGNAVAIILGQQLGMGDIQRARDSQKKLVFVSVAASVLTGALMAAFSGLFPLAYNTTDNVRAIAANLIIVSAIWMPINSYVNACYFTLRSGGQAFITFLFDSCFVWVASVPIAYILSRFTNLDIVSLYAICLGVDLIKCIIGFFFVRSGKWAKNIVAEKLSDT